MSKVIEVDAKEARKNLSDAIAQAELAPNYGKRLITKIRVGGQTNVIEYDRVTDTEPEHCIVKFADEIHPDLEIKLNQLLPRAIDAIGLDDTMWKHGTVTGVDIKYAGDISGCKVFIKNQLEDFEVPLSTPFLAVELGWADQMQLTQLCQEAEDCLDGKRSQGDLFFKGEEAR